MALNTDVRTKPAFLIIPKLIEAALSGNRQRVELLSVTAARLLKDESPDVAKQIGALLAQSSGLGGPVRWVESEPPPADQDAGMALLKVDTIEPMEPVLGHDIQDKVELFIRERLRSEQLLVNGFLPPRTLLLKGPPGTGKTMLARCVAKRLDLRLVVLDLATSISSYLGKTGFNLRRSLDYARANPCVLLLDEFDAVAKRRDDSADVSELNRVVNVLLKELKDWPINSVLIGATNHPELLDKAINRRFDVVIELSLPGLLEREAILRRACGEFAVEIPNGLIGNLNKFLVGLNGSELETLAQGAVRRHIVEGVPLGRSMTETLGRRAIATSLSGAPYNKKDLHHLILAMHENIGLSVRDLGALFGLSSSTIQYHLKKDQVNADVK